ncbi:MAG: hypothetical protein IJX19_09815, partial [Clostridia bacterium]|nr:hypothetical protein [Clostridia bacterium]
FYGAGAGKLPTASAVVADIIDILSNKSAERKLPVWKVADADDMASSADYVCRRAYLVEGCIRCAEKAKAALKTEECVMIEGGRFVVVSAAMSETQANEAFASTGLDAIVTLPVLD